MAYNKTNWVNENEPAINADNLNKIEAGIEDNSLQLESYGRTINELNAPEKWVSVGATAPTDGRRVWFKKSKNLFTSNALPNGTTIGITKTFDNSEIKLSGTSTSGAELLLQTSLGITLPAGTYTMSYIKKSGSVTLSPGKDIALYLRKLGATTNLVTHTVREINSSKRSTTFTLTEETTLSYYMYCNNSGIVLNDFAIQVQIEEGSTATTYEPYIEKSINVDEEEWYNSNNIEKYSTNEIKIGTWIDGKPIYRKVINIGALPNATTKTITHNISNLSMFIRVSGIAYSPAGYTLLPYVQPALPNLNVGIFANSTQVVVITTTDKSTNSGYAILEYTKTTD